MSQKKTEQKKTKHQLTEKALVPETASMKKYVLWLFLLTSQTLDVGTKTFWKNTSKLLKTDKENIIETKKTPKDTKS